MKKNKKAFTLVELVTYIAITISITIVVFSIYNKTILNGKTQELTLTELHNINNSQKFLGRALQNVNGILLLKHTKAGTHISNYDDITINNKAYNQHVFNFLELRNKCGFLVEPKYDIAAFTTKDGLDPIIIGVIQKRNKKGRLYKQLALYKYYSLYSQRDIINEEIKNGNISDILDENGNLKTEGLTDYKCNPDNGFLIPLSSKFYEDEIKNFDFTTYLDQLKIIVYVKTPFIDEIKKYKNGLIEIELDWASINKEKKIIDYQVYSQNFKY